jgi:hypothetical protein
MARGTTICRQARGIGHDQLELIQVMLLIVDAVISRAAFDQASTPGS